MAIFGKLQDLLKEELNDQKPLGQRRPSSRPVTKKTASDDPEMTLLAAKAEIDKKLGALEERERILLEKEKNLEDRLTAIQKIKDDALATLEKAANMTKDEARNRVLKAWEEKLKEEILCLVCLKP